MQLPRPEGPSERPMGGGGVTVAALHVAAVMVVRPTGGLDAVGEAPDPVLTLNRTRGDDVIVRIDGLNSISKTPITFCLWLVLFASRFVS